MVQYPQGNWCRRVGIPCQVLGFIVEHEGDAFWCHQHSGMSSTAIKNCSLDPKAGKTKTVYLWALTCDDLTWEGANSPAVIT